MTTRLDILAMDRRPTRPGPASARGDRLRRTADVAIASVGLVVAAPVLTAIALAVRVEDGGPAVYRQRRAGGGCRPFSMLKFRTMHVQADRGGAPAWPGEKDPRDPRVTRIGRLLRRTSLDELPQLLNVLRGDMSIVGPRPLPLEEAPLVPEWASERWDVRPGMTGLWQVLGRSRIPWEERMDLDVAYVRNRSLGMDARLMVRTVGAVLSGRGAY
jgi:lipopolysaccharide/colanic/teichoic acid biosynthesis glycosyltransferase